MDIEFIEKMSLFWSLVNEDLNLYNTYEALNISALWSVRDCPIKLGTRRNRKWASTIPMHIVISETSFDTVNAVSSYKNILYYYSYFNF